MLMYRTMYRICRITFYNNSIRKASNCICQMIYGIVKWLKELKKYGADFTVNNYSFLDEVIINGDDSFFGKCIGYC